MPTHPTPSSGTETRFVSNIAARNAINGFAQLTARLEVPVCGCSTSMVTKEKSTQSYNCFMPFAAGGTEGGFYCFSTYSPNAMDNWSSIHGDVLTDWLRLELTNIDRGDERAADEQLPHEIHGPWAAAHVYTLVEDANGVLTKDKLVFTRELWWWNDNPPLGYDYGYFGVFVKDEAETKIRNFTLCYTDK